MSHFSEFQLAHFRSVFDLFARPNGRVYLEELCSILLQYGPEIPVEEADSLIQKFGGSLPNSLTFAEFTLLLGEYEKIFEEKKVELIEALKYFEKRRQDVEPEAIKNKPGFAERQFKEILLAGEDPLDPLEAKEIVLDMNRAKSRRVTTKKFLRRVAFDGFCWTKDLAPPVEFETEPLREISFRILHIDNLVQLARVKVSGNKGIRYETLDCMVRVRCADTSVQTTVLLDSLQPEWNQELVMSVLIPYRRLVDVQDWIEAQTVYIDLLDVQLGGVSLWTEWIGTASLPLSQVLKSRVHPVSYKLHLNTFSHASAKSITIDLSIFHCARSDEMVLVEFFRPPEEVWLQNSRSKMIADLSHACEFDVPVSAVRGNQQLLGHIENIFRAYRGKFRRRNIRLVAQDEYDNFRFLPCFLAPLELGPVYQGWTPEIAFQNLAALSLTDSTLPLSTCDGLRLSTHIGSPNTVLFRGYASEIERAFLFCSVLLGLGCDAYVAFGADSMSTRTWVITFPSKNTNSQQQQQGPAKSPSRSNSDDKSDSDNEDEEKDPGNSSQKLTHWDVVTGKSYTNASKATCPFVELTTMCNHKNIWINTQASENPFAMELDLQKPSNWQVLFDGSSHHLQPVLKCWFNRFCLHSFRSSPAELVLTSLVSRIQAYRKDKLFLPRTFFYRPISRLLQANMEAINQIYQIHDLAELTEFEARLEEQVLQLLPERHIWFGRSYFLQTQQTDRIMDELMWSGILDCSIPECMYCIATRTYSFAWDLHCVWVYVGYIYDVCRYTVK